MVKIYENKSKQLIDGLANSDIISILLYGQDSGRVSDLGKEISAKITPDINDPFMVANIGLDSLSEDSTVIYDEMMAISFGSGKRLVTIKNTEGADAAKAITKAVEQLPDDCAQTSFLLVQAGDLAATSPLRKLYESNNPKIVAIPCYKQDAKDLSATIFNLVQEKGIYIEQEAASYLAECCQGDSRIIQNEIEKLMLYLEGVSEKITYEDVIITTGNTTENQLQDICDAVLSGNRVRIEDTYRKVLETGIAPIAILRALQRYFEKLHQAYFYVKDGNNIDMAIKYIKPPIFYKKVPLFKSHLQKMLERGEERIFSSYGYILNAEFDTKQTDANPEMITSRLLQKIAA